MIEPDEVDLTGQRGPGESSRRVARARGRLERIRQHLVELGQRRDDLARQGGVAAHSPEQAQTAVRVARDEAVAAGEDAARAYELSADAHDQAERVRRRAGRESGSPAHPQAAAWDREQAQRVRREAARDRDDPGV